jgi:arsenite methyltransferase
MNEPTSEQTRQAVRDRYGSIARSATEQGCGPSCCGSGADSGRELGYSAAEIAAAPEGSNLGLGCGNPQAIAALKEGETVLDLGSGGGFDCFLAARQVGPNGHVIGVDMTADMVTRARANARRSGAGNVEFRLGEIEHLPVADSTVDVILSNCVINLSPDKSGVFRDAFRVLKPGGRLAISDVVTTKPLPADVAVDLSALTGCVAGAASADTVRTLLEEAGFRQIRVEINEASREFIRDWMPGSGIENHVASATIEAVKPEAASCCGSSCCGD